MKIEFSVPLSYQRHVRGAIAMALDEVVRDVLARVEGREPIVPDFLVDVELRGTVTVVLEETDLPTEAVMREGVKLSPRDPSIIPIAPFIKKAAS
jgi:hypothetical protein